MKEEWKPVPGYEEYYMASNFGRIMSLSRTIDMPNGGVRICKEKILAQATQSNGYKTVNLAVRGTRKQAKVHRLVMLSFNGSRNTDVQVNHIDGNKANNCLDNLEYVTASENRIHYTRVLKKGVGELSGRAKLTTGQVKKIRNLYSDGQYTQASLGQIFGVRDTAINKIIRRHNWAWLD